MDNLPKAGEVWQHYRTKGEYEILGVGNMQVKTEALDMKECVMYKALADNKLWCRPLEDFVEEVILEEGVAVPRFAKIK